MLVKIHVKVHFTACCNLWCIVYMGEHCLLLCTVVVCAWKVLNAHMHNTLQVIKHSKINLHIFFNQYCILHKVIL